MTALFFDDIMAFHKMMYQQRSAETEREMKRRKREIGQARKRIAELDSFAAIIRKYVGIKELTPAIVNELLRKS